MDGRYEMFVSRRERIFSDPKYHLKLMLFTKHRGIVFGSMAPQKLVFMSKVKLNQKIFL
jgi:hypothetical protein